MKVFAAAAALALALLGSADAGRVKVKGSKDPSPAHEKEIRQKMAAAVQHVRNGGQEDMKLQRVHDLIEAHGGFVTDMLKEYRPSLMSKWIKKATNIHRMVASDSRTPENVQEERKLGEKGTCYDTYKHEWACTLQGCWCDRAMDQSVSMDSGPDGSNSCDDSSEYASYACDLSSVPLDVKVEADANCLPACTTMWCDDVQDDWVQEFFTNGSNSVQEVEAVADEDEECPEWPYMCCGAETCVDETASSGTVCASFQENIYCNLADIDDIMDAWGCPEDDLLPTMSPTWMGCSSRWTDADTDDDTTDQEYAWTSNIDDKFNDAFVNSTSSYSWDTSGQNIASGCTFTYGTAASQDVIVSMIGSMASVSSALSSASPAMMLVVTMFSLAMVRLAVL